MLTATEVRNLPIGARVVFPDGASAYPDFNFKDRLTGTVMRQEIDCTWVQIHDYKSALAEWNNEIQVWDWADELDRASYNIERLLSPADDESLGQFIRDYCEAHAIECDGDAFGMVFSEEREWSTSEAATVIEMAANVYSLRKAVL